MNMVKSMNIRLKAFALRLLGFVAISSLTFLSLNAQEKKERRGSWFEVGYEGGELLKKNAFEGLAKGEKLSGNFYASFGFHIPIIKRLQLGIGLNATGYGNPNYKLYGVHLYAKWRPFKAFRALQFSGRLTTPLSTHGQNASGTTFDAKSSGSLAVGLEIPRIIGTIGISPAIGISYSSFKYSYLLDGKSPATARTQNDAQGTVFLRLALILN